MRISMPRGGRDDAADMARIARNRERLAGMRRRIANRTRQIQPFFYVAAMPDARDDLLPGITALGETHATEGIEIEIQREEFSGVSLIHPGQAVQDIPQAPGFLARGVNVSLAPFPE